MPDQINSKTFSHMRLIGVEIESSLYSVIPRYRALQIESARYRDAPPKFCIAGH